MTHAIDTTIPDLPDWMRQARRGVDWGLLLVIGFSLLVAWPFIALPTLPHTNASENYVYAAANFAAAFQEGRLYPRWSPYALGGYGAPLPHYYPPGAPFLAGLLQVLLTGDAVSAVRLAYILALVLAGTAVYSLVTRRTNAAAGLLAAVLYLYSPYTGLVAPHLLGDLAVMLALALLPALLGCADRLLLRRRPLDVLLVALLTAALVFTHVGLALAGIVLVLTLALWQRLALRRSRGRLVMAGLLLGVGMAACFWIPALLEQPAIHWRPPLAAPPYRLSLAGLVAPLQQPDSSDLTPPPQFTLGLPALAFAGLGVAAILRCRQFRSIQAFFLATGLVTTVVTVLALPGETALLGVITLSSAVGGSAALNLRDSLPSRWRRVALPATLILIWILAAPVWLPPPVTEPFGGYDAAAQIQHEQSGYGVAALPPTLPVPSTLPNHLPPNRLLVESYLSGCVNRVSISQTDSVPVRVGLLGEQTHSSRFQVSTGASATLDVLLAYFPGWRASLNGLLIPLFPHPQTNLTRVTIPPVRGGQLVLELGSTQERLGAWLITWLALAIALILTWGRFRRYVPVYQGVTLLTKAEARLVALALGCAALFTPLTVLPGSPLSLRLPPGHALNHATSLSMRTDAGLSVLAYRLNGTQFRSGDTLDLTLYWQAQRALPENYRVLLYLLDIRTGARWNEQPFHHPGGYPTRRWNTSRYVSASYVLPLNRAMPPGPYQVALEVFACTPDCLPQNRVTFFDATGRNIGPVLYLPTLTVLD
ncbi:MAG: hypothetical protein HZC41_14320 [Chloroflexi bacterium]|nr:hypothetical protein [Chloroflexota bacterium]